MVTDSKIRPLHQTATVIFRAGYQNRLIYNKQVQEKIDENQS